MKTAESYFQRSWFALWSLSPLGWASAMATRILYHLFFSTVTAFVVMTLVKPFTATFLPPLAGLGIKRSLLVFSSIFLTETTWLLWGRNVAVLGLAFGLLPAWPKRK